MSISKGSESVSQRSEYFASTFQRFFNRGGYYPESTEIRRVVYGLVSSSDGNLETDWSLWALDAGRAFNLQLSACDIDSLSAYKMVESGATLLSWCSIQQKFLILSQNERKQVVYGFDSLDLTEVVSSARHLNRIIESHEEKPRQRWIAMIPNRANVRNDDDSDASHHHHSSGITPLTRLWRMLRPEFSDIAVLIVLGIVVGLLATAVPIAGQQLVRTVTFGTLYQPIVVLTLLLLMFLGFMGVLQAMSVVVVELIQQRMFVRTVAELSQKLPRTRLHALSEAGGPELINRFLDIATVQKVVAGLLVDGLALCLTTIMGMALLAFYHPFLLGYDILLLLLLLFVVVVLGRGGTKTAIRESFEKYRVAAWLEDLARCPVAFHSAGGAEFALARADSLTVNYVDARRRHFRVLLRQILCLFAIQAIASTSLLGIGGYLVMHEQLTLGQLVAAELVVTMIVGVFAKLSKHIEGFFDLMAAMDKLGLLMDLPLEHSGRSFSVNPDAPLAELWGVNVVSLGSGEHEGKAASTSHSNPNEHSLIIEAGKHTVIYGASGSGKSSVAETLFGLHEDHGRRAFIGGCDIRELDSYVARRHVALVRSVEILNGTVEENIHLGRGDVDRNRVRCALEAACVYGDVVAFEHGLQTRLSGDGSPLTDSQQVQLMLARGIAGKPKLLVIDSLLDRLPDELLERLLNVLKSKDNEWTLLVFTGRADIAKRFEQPLQLVD